MYIGIKDGKVFDICSDLRNKRDNTIEDDDYLEIDNSHNIVVEDTWDSQNNVSLQDAPSRTAPPKKTTLELRLEQMEAKILKLEIKGELLWD